MKSIRQIILIFFPVLLLVAVSLYGGTSYTIGSESLKGTVLDNTTGLRWLRCPLGIGGTADSSAGCIETDAAYTWTEAVSACDNLSFAGGTWRLPTIRELQSITLLHYNTAPRINAKVFPNTGNNIYWSSTTHIGRSNTAGENANYAWCIDFGYGNLNPYNKAVNADFGKNIVVRCVMNP